MPELHVSAIGCQGRCRAAAQSPGSRVTPASQRDRAARRACQGEDGKDDLKKGTQLLEVYALEIQMHTELKNTKRLKELYSRALTIKSAIPHPRIMGIIRECGGKMHMHERVWSEAATDFFEVPLRWNVSSPQKHQASQEPQNGLDSCTDCPF